MSKLKPAYLFYAIAIIAFVFFIIEGYKLLTPIHPDEEQDYFQISYLGFVIIFNLSIALVYTHYSRIQKPLSNPLGYLHFFITLIGLYCSFLTFGLIYFYFIWLNVGELVSATDILKANSKLALIMIYTGPFILLISILILTIAVFRARKKARLVTN